MNILEQIFRNEKPEQPEFTADQSFDLLFDWFKASNIEISTFEKEFLSPVKEIYALPENASNHSYNNYNTSEIYFYLRIAFPYIIYQNPDNSFLERLFALYQAPNSLSANTLYSDSHPPLFFEHPELYIPLIAGRKIFFYYHAIHLKINENISFLPLDFRGLKNQNRELYFEKILAYVNAQQFKEKAYMLFLLYNSPFDYKLWRSDVRVITEEKYGSLIEQSFRESIAQCNALYGFHLHFDDFVLLRDIFSLQAPATKRSLTLEKFKEGLSFIQQVKGQETRMAETAIYLLMNHFLYDHQVYWKPVLQRLAQNSDCDADWLLQKLKTKYGLSEQYNSVFIFDNFYTEVFNRLKGSLNYEDEVISVYENILYNYAYNKTQKPNATGLIALKELAGKVENPEWKLMYESKISNYYFKSAYSDRYNYGLEELLRGAQMQALLSDLQLLMPISVVNIPTKLSYPDSYIAKISYNYTEHNIYYGSVQTLINSLLKSAGSAYRLIMIPVYADNWSYFYALAFMSYPETKFFIEFYLDNFAKGMAENQVEHLMDSLEFEKLNYDPNQLEAIPFAHFKANKLSEKTGQKIKNRFLDDPNWVWFKNKYVDELNSKEQWYEVMNVIVQCSGSKKPNTKWLAELKEVIETLGAEKYFKELQILMAGSLKEDFWYDANFRGPLSGLLWSCTQLSPNDLSLSIVKMVIQSAYAKIPGIGPKSTATGNLGLEALVSSGKDEAFGLLVIMHNKTKYNNFARALEKSIDKFKATSTTPEQLLADKTIPGFGFENGERILDGGNCLLKLTLENQKINKQWLNKQNEKLKNAPYDINKKTLDEINLEVKQITAVFNDLKKRIRTYWLYDRVWTGAEWKSYLLGHPFISSHIENLIWTNKSKGTDFILINHELLDSDGKVYALNDTDEVGLWHPVVNTEENVARWQNYIWTNNIKQPERQAFREHYPFSDTELSQTESSRFAHHFLEVRKLMAIANAAGWIFTYEHEDKSWPRVYIKPLNLTAHIPCDYDRNSFAVPTKNLYFTRDNSTKIAYNLKTYEKILLSEIPLVTLSEICRDIDLFIATTSVSNNPELSDNKQTYHNYNDSYHHGLFSDNASAKIRKQIIEKLIPVLNINSSGFDKNYWIINGSKHIYRINLGSGFAQIKDSQKHINLIPNVGELKKNKRLRLPIEDDDTLYIILAKALFLQNDANITIDVLGI
ncbi:DUF4132 domain-containing protein [Emticicia agri]|uniref:DUF4132 domain-containing protein n=1 Tax=Emticicia agri TaxID=2492393 RepID=A0A4Q5LUU6_9BACT|nr:DUF4132 domain-containing protein [Emticicia agri]RYU93476.1 DUF4132 domain-containing protein [Emticicia agri]